jgi:hypothetical protein
MTLRMQLPAEETLARLSDAVVDRRTLAREALQLDSPPRLLAGSVIASHVRLTVLLPGQTMPSAPVLEGSVKELPSGTSEVSGVLRPNIRSRIGIAATGCFFALLAVVFAVVVIVDVTRGTASDAGWPLLNVAIGVAGFVGFPRLYRRPLGVSADDEDRLSERVSEAIRHG